MPGAERMWVAFWKEALDKPHMMWGIQAPALSAERAQDMDDRLMKCQAMKDMSGVCESLGGQIFLQVVSAKAEAKVLAQTRHQLISRVSMPVDFFPAKHAEGHTLVLWGGSAKPGKLELPFGHVIRILVRWNWGNGM